MRTIPSPRSTAQPSVRDIERYGPIRETAVAINLLFGWPLLLLGSGLAGIALVGFSSTTFALFHGREKLRVTNVRVFGLLAAFAVWMLAVSYPFDPGREQTTIWILVLGCGPLFVVAANLRYVPWSSIAMFGLPVAALSIAAATTTHPIVDFMTNPISTIVRGHVAWITLLAVLNTKQNFPVRLGLSLACVTALYLTDSSGPQVAGLLAISYFLSSEWRGIPARVGMLTVLLSLGFLTVSAISTELSSTPTAINNALTRLDVWRSTLENYHPVGHGVVDIPLTAGRTLGNAHNFALDALWVAGPLGLFLVAAAAILSWWSSRRVSRADRSLKLGLLVAVVFSGSVASPAAWIAIGLGLSYSRRTDYGC